MRICNLTCDYMANPIGFDFRKPGFGWMTESDAVNGSQSAYRIQIARSDGFSDLVVDSGRIDSELSACVQVEVALEPRTRYFWRVRIWDNEGRESDWSEAAWFETGKYDEPWSARWIGWEREFPQLRKAFALNKPVKSARAYACGVGLYVMYLNGERVSDEYLAPGFTAYDSWLQYQTYDVTDLLKPGGNVVGCQLGNGYY